MKEENFREGIEKGESVGSVPSLRLIQ